MSDEQVISDPSDLKKYRTELPNLYDDADLDVYEHRLLCHYKRVGECTEGLETTAKKCKMSEGKVSEARQTLSDKGWITLQRVEMDKGRYRFIVRVVDHWIENFAKYSGFSAEQIAHQLKKASPSPREGIPSPHEASPSPREGKKELVKNLSDERFGRVCNKLAEVTGGGLNPQTADLVNTWLEKHSDEWIFEAIEIAKGKNARSEKYVDSILIGWEANGYPKTRDEKVQGAKNGNNVTGYKPGSKSTGPAKTNHSTKPAYTDADRAAAALVKSKRQAPVS